MAERTFEAQRVRPDFQVDGQEAVSPGGIVHCELHTFNPMNALCRETHDWKTYAGFTRRMLPATSLNSYNLHSSAGDRQFKNMVGTLEGLAGARQSSA
ncbi:MAG: hypothetical protein A3H27_04205 [Acidobacteria bacterium RIFCSPLOWO2_02_FULL_59_13]|nr:MAG: hypothetical protein A3H27_04205 [Acidobacteria bacterium RIFCSPLOWO2_02_FULL_59_13]